MGGAVAGLCLDATGSIAWNPACPVRLDGKWVEVHGTLFDPWRSLSSTVDANAFGPGFPSQTMSGTTVSKRDMSFMPGVAFIYHAKDSNNAFFFAMLAVSGFGVDYAESTNFSNPILTPQQPNGFGFGRLRSNYALVKIPLGISRRVNNKLSVGFALEPALSMLQVIPAPFVDPVTAGNGGYPYYLPAHNNAPAMGFGFAVGVNYEVNKKVSLGASFDSPVWFMNFNWKSADLTGAVHNLTFNMDLPLVVTAGIGWRPNAKTAIGIDTHWFNYSNTAGFDQIGFDQYGAVKGFGWQNIWAVGAGIQRQISKADKIILGYNYSQNPVPDQYAFFNMPAPAIVQHHLSVGYRHKITATYEINSAYYHAFENSDTSAWYTPAGPVPGTSVTNRMHENSLTIGLSHHF